MSTAAETGEGSYRRWSDLDDRALARALAQSGYWEDISQASQALAKILFGRELGFGPAASLSNIYIQDGKPEVQGHLIAAGIRRSGKYEYRIRTLTEERCEIEILRADGEDLIGTSRFDRDDAKQAGLLGKPMWEKYPRNMLFNRCISNAHRWFCPDVFQTNVYALGEISDAEPERRIVPPVLRKQGGPDEETRSEDGSRASSDVPPDSADPQPAPDPG